ncbi:MAG: TIGR03905 family TSCPD domain-containing protein [bacterium]|nr:TIGR03905 family TSCPD domain-containing protein [bacterium]
MQNYTYETAGVCTKAISFSIDDGKVYGIRFFGGCPGNLLAISKLLEGEDAEKVVETLKGNDCGGKGTSCADQLARAVEQALAHSKAN